MSVDVIEKLNEYQQVLAQDPQSELFVPLAEGYVQMNLLDAAVEVLKRGLRYHPRKVGGLTLLGRVYGLQGDVDAARNQFDQVLSQQADAVPALLGLAELDLAEGNFRRSEERYHQARSCSPSDARVSAFGDRLSAALTTETDDSAGDLPCVSETIIDLYLQQGLTEKAIVALRALLQKSPHDQRLQQRLNLVQGEGSAGDSSVAQHQVIPERRRSSAQVFSAWLAVLEQRRKHV
ncbi:MAG: hypothetical protein JXR59_06755 [Desulfuromonadaceae bacterium]|nr:hypothetical protein [Desulfuromonadaceae bacterium]